MRILVTGADGFVGQHVVHTLLRRRHEVVGGITGPSPRLSTLSDDDARRVDWRLFDLRDAASVRALVDAARPDAVLHLAGISSVSQGWREPEATFAINATGSLHLLLALRALPPPAASAASAASDSPRAVVLVGSGEAYGHSGTESDPLTEQTPLRPVNPYGASKAAQEMLGFALGRGAGMRLVQTRSFQQIGPGQRPDFVTVDWARQLLDIRDRGRPAVLEVGNLDVSRDFLDVRDAAEAYATLLENRDADGLYNVCSGRETSLRRLLELLRSVTGVRVEVRVDPERLRPADIPALVGDPERLRTTTGWTPRIPLRSTLADLVTFLQRQHAA